MKAKKIIIISYLFFLLTHNVFADTAEHSFSSNVILTIDTGANTINILIEGNNNTYSFTNSTNSYTINFKRNITCSNSTQQVINYYYDSYPNNVSNILNQMTSQCQRIADAYGDASSYYKPLLECTTSKSQCEKDRDIHKQNSDKAISLEANYNTCLTEKKNFETQFTTCNIEQSKIKADILSQESQLEQAKSNSKLYGWASLALLLAAIIYFYKQKKKEKETPLERMPHQP